MTLSSGTHNMPSLAETGFSLQRHRKVVLVVDLVESVSLMQADELGVITRWQAFLQHVNQVVLPANEGRLVKSLGDGLMVEFESAPRAMAAASAMHAWMAESYLEADRPMRLRAGLHSAQIYADSADIYGTGVNLAARLATLARPTETVVSTDVRDAITDGLDGVIEDMGECYLKHLDAPVRAWKVTTNGQASTPYSAQSEVVSLRPTIAVIPFDARSSDANHIAVGELIADGVIGQLSRTPELRVISRLSTTAFRGRQEKSDAALTYLGADHVLSGSYGVMGDKLLVTAELVDTRSTQIVWATRISGGVADLFEQHSELCAELAHGCHQALLESHAEEAISKPLPNLQSYSLLLGGVGLMHRSTPVDFMKSREVLEAVIDRHGRAASPRVWLAKWHVLRATRGLVTNAKSEGQIALDQTQRALDAEPGNALALAMRGFVYCHLLKDMDQAMSSCNEALEHNANESLAWLFMAMMRAFDGDGEASWPAGKKALGLSPVDPLRYYYDSLMASIAISAGRYPDAIEFAQRSLRANSVHLSTYRALAMAHALSEDFGAARRTMGLLLQRDPQFTVARFEKAYPARERVPEYLRKLSDALRACGVPEH